VGGEKARPVEPKFEAESRGGVLRERAVSPSPVGAACMLP